MVTATRPPATVEVASSIPELKGFDDFVRKLMRDWKVNGVAVAIVKGDEVVLSRGYGLRNVEKDLEVNAHTLMAIGSTTKTFTTAGVALLADDGLVDWDTPVRTYLPTFKLWDAVATERTTPRDMASHRTGLPRHDLMWYGSTQSRKHLFDRLQYLEPSADFRTIWQYQNLMYMTLGYLTGELGGMEWEDFIRTRIFEPLGMTSSTMTSTEARESPDLSIGYRRKKNEVLPMALYEGFHAVAPAGSIMSCVADMSQWLLVHLNNGKLGDRQFISEAQIRDMHSPQTIMPGGKHEEMPYSSYGLGWFVQPYRGKRVIHHGGNIDGFSTMFGLMPDEKVGVVVLTNMDGTPVRDILMHNVWDRFIGGKPVPWNARVKADYKEMEAGQARGKEKAKSDRVPRTRPSHPLTSYAGTYTHPGYGPIRIEVDGTTAKAHYNDLEFNVKHYHYDTFDITYERFGITLKASFFSDVRGQVATLSVPFEPSVADIVFTRAADESMTSHDFLAQFTGSYEVMGNFLTVEFKGDVLQVSLPGLPGYELVPFKGTEFTVKGLTGFSIEFTRDQSGTVVGAQVNQMGTVLEAKKH